MFSFSKIQDPKSEKMFSNRITNVKTVRIVLFLVLITSFCFVVFKLIDTFPDSDSHLTGASLVSLQIKQLRAQLGRLKRELAKNQIVNPYEYLDSMPIIYAITPTHTRPVQKADLVRLSQTLLLVPNLHWIIVEDSEVKTPLVANLLANSGLSYTHLNAATPKEWKLLLSDPQWKKPRGVLQRNTAIEWLQKHADPRKPAVVYFADDDNTYSIDVFEEMRSTQKVSVWPVGLVAHMMYERPVLDDKNVVSAWETAWRPERPFAIDMAGFAINLQLLLENPEAKFSFEVPRGYQESTILKALVKKEELEPKADMCTKVHVWHTRTENPKMNQTAINMQRKASSVFIEV